MELFTVQEAMLGYAAVASFKRTTLKGKRLSFCKGKRLSFCLYSDGSRGFNVYLYFSYASGDKSNAACYRCKDLKEAFKKYIELDHHI